MAENKIVLSGREKKNINLKGDLDVVASSFSNASLIVHMEKEMQISVHIQAEEGAKLTVFFQNASVNLITDETVEVFSNAEVHIAYCELESGRLERKSRVYLKGSEARAELISGAFVDTAKMMDIVCDHCVPHTYSDMKNYAVILTGGDYQISANGKIERGAYGSRTHQTSRVLTFAEKQNARVIPLLMIDENDVEASHATSIGQLDENQLYYLMSRGITKAEALKLISLGYLMPLTQVSDDEELREYLTQLIEKKVTEACLM